MSTFKRLIEYMEENKEEYFKKIISENKAALEEKLKDDNLSDKDRKFIEDYIKNHLT